MIKNKIEFKVQYKYNKDKKVNDINISTMIDGDAYLPGLVINIFQLDNSLITEGYCPLFVCTCGDQGCGGVWETPIIDIHDTFILWRITSPHKRTLVFDKKVIANAINDLKNDLLSHMTLNESKEIDYLAYENLYRFLR